MRLTEKDIDFVDRVLRDESVYPWISDDGSVSAGAFTTKPFFYNPSVYVLSPNQWSVFIFLPVNSCCFDVHSNVLPEGRGVKAIVAGKAVLNWMFQETKCLKVITSIPVFNAPAYALARRCGMTPEGKNRKSFLHKGVLYDQHMLGITEEEWLCLQ